MREIRTILAAGAFVLAGAAFALVLAFAKAPAGGEKVFKIEAVPVIDPVEAARIMEKLRQEEIERYERQQVEKKRALAREVLQKLLKEHGGRLPDKLVLQTDIILPGPFGSKKVERKKSAPVIVYPKKGRIELEVLANRVTREMGRVEFLLCNPHMPSQAYESVFVTEAHPFDVFRALVVLGLKPGRGVRYKQTPTKLTGDMVDIYLVWKDKSGKTVKRHASEFVWNIGSTKPVKRTKWVFIGSRFGYDITKKKEFFAAHESGNIIGIVHWPTVILDTPDEEFGYDEYVFNPKALPEPGTQMKMVIETVKEKR